VQTAVRIATVIGLYKTEIIRQHGPWCHLEAAKFATLEWVDWFNYRRLLEYNGHVPPAEFEEAHYAQAQGSARAPDLIKMVSGKVGVVHRPKFTGGWAGTGSGAYARGRPAADIERASVLRFHPRDLP